MPRTPKNPRRRRRPPRQPKNPPTMPSERTLSLVEHATLEQLPALTRKRVQWLAGKLDMGEVAVISLAVLRLTQDEEDQYISE